MFEFIRQAIILSYLYTFSYAVLGFFIGTAIVAILWFKGFLKRKNIILKVLTTLYYIYIPIVIGLFAWAYKADNHLQKTTLVTIDNALEASKKGVYPQFRSFVSQNIDKITGTPPKSNQEIVDLFIKEHLKEQKYVYKFVVRFVLTHALDYGLGNEQQRKEKLKDGLAKTLLDTSFDKIKDKLHSIIGGYFTQVKVSTILILLVLLLIPATEIIVSYRIRKKRFGII